MNVSFSSRFVASFTAISLTFHLKEMGMPHLMSRRPFIYNFLIGYCLLLQSLTENSLWQHNVTIRPKVSKFAGKNHIRALCSDEDTCVKALFHKITLSHKTACCEDLIHSSLFTIMAETLQQYNRNI